MSRYGNISLINLIEHELSFKEQQIFTGIIKSMIDQTGSLTNLGIEYFSIMEIMICCFHLECTLFLRQLGINSFLKLLKFKEGYFLLRAIVKVTKDPKAQKEICDLVISNFSDIAFTQNGSLICQAVIYNFPLAKYVHLLTTSGYIWKEQNIMINKGIFYDNSNKSTNELISTLFNFPTKWGVFHLRQIVDCALRNSKGIFESKFMAEIRKDNLIPLKAIYFNIKLEDGLKLLREILFTFDISNSVEVVRIYKHRVMSTDSAKCNKESWFQLLEEFYESPKIKALRSKNKNNQRVYTYMEKSKNPLNNLVNKPIMKQNHIHSEKNRLVNKLSIPVITPFIPTMNHMPIHPQLFQSYQQVNPFHPYQQMMNMQNHPGYQMQSISSFPSFQSQSLGSQQTQPSSNNFLFNSGIIYPQQYQQIAKESNEEINNWKKKSDLSAKDRKHK